MYTNAVKNRKCRLHFFYFHRFGASSGAAPLCATNSAYPLFAPLVHSDICCLQLSAYEHLYQSHCSSGLLLLTQLPSLAHGRREGASALLWCATALCSTLRWKAWNVSNHQATWLPECLEPLKSRVVSPHREGQATQVVVKVPD